LDIKKLKGMGIPQFHYIPLSFSKKVYGRKNWAQKKANSMKNPPFSKNIF